MRLHIRDRNEAVALALEREFRGAAGVEVSCGDILERAVDAIVSPPASPVNPPG